MTRPDAFRFYSLRGEWPHAAVISVCLWALYLLTAPRTVVLEDDGLFILSSWFLGIEHPPGYPLYVLLGKLATLWPFGAPAWRVHALTGLFGAISCSLVYLSARLLGLRRPAAYLAGMGFGVSATFWSQAIIADVYSLNAMLFFALLLLALSASREAAAGRGYGRLADRSALIAGLGVANHWPLLLLSAPGLALLWSPAWRFVLRRLPVMLVWFCVGLLPYAWMVWRSQMRPEISFLGPIDSWKEFVFYVLRQGYAGTDNNAAAGVADKLLYLSYLVREAGGQLLLPGAALAVVGFIVQWQRWGRITAWALTLSFLGPTLLLTLLLNFDYDPFRREAFRFYPAAAWGLLALWAGLGLQVVVDRFPMCWQQRAVVSAAALMVLAAGGAHWARNDRSGDWLGREYAATVLAELEPDAVLLVQGDLDLPTTGYLHLIEGRRPDVQLVSEQSLVLEPRLFDPFQTPKDAAANIVDAYARDCGRPVYRTLSSDMRPGTVSWLLFKLDPASEAGAGKQHYRFPPGERALLKRIVAHGPFRDGWSEFLRRFLYEAFIRFQTRAELAGEWPGKNDPELARMIDSVLDLPEAALMRAAVLSDADALGKADEIHVLLERFAAQVGDPWVKKHHLARYYNVVARGAQLSGHHRVARVALTRSLAYWPEAANPATKAEASYRRHEQQKGE